MTDFVYDPEKCTEVVEFDCPDDVLLKLALIAHEREITLNHLMNEILYYEIEQQKNEEGLSEEE